MPGLSCALQVTDGAYGKKSGFVMVQVGGEAMQRRWLSVEGPYLACYDGPDKASERSKPRAVVSLSSFDVHRGDVSVRRC